MPDWCPKCNAMLAPGLESCPVCGAKLGKNKDGQGSGREIAWLSIYIIAIALIPLLIAFGIGLICMLVYR